MSNGPPSTFSLQPFDYAEVCAIRDELELAEPVAVTLVRRGHRTVDAARAFLEAAEEHDPFEFAGMDGVVERIRAAAATGRRITVHGDYDVDGVCSTAITIAALRRLGADCDWLIPGRVDDGYGITEATVEKLRARGTDLLITVDCGITSVAEVASARAAGIDVIVTDHHQPGPELPEAPILHPVVSGYPCSELCATAVAFKLAVALHGPESCERELDLVALATVADLVPLRGENRALVRRGLAEARRARRPGMRALIAAAGVAAERLDEGDFAFRLAPRINAAGRLYRADAGVELMLTDDDERAAEIAAELDRANYERREVEREVLAGAERELAALPPELAEAPGLVLAGEGWHPGVVGIVASRLAEQLVRPVVLVALEAGGGGRGSGRSAAGVDLLSALDRCADHLARYGGHRAAAGVEIAPGALEGFRAAFAAAVAEAMPEGGFVRSETLDAIVGGESLGHDVAEQLGRLGPFGLGNPGVRLLVPGAWVDDVRPMGEGDRHARFRLASGSNRALGVAFSVNGSLARSAATGPHDVSVTLELNEWNGAVSPRVVLGSLYAVPDADADAGDPEPLDAIAEVEFWERLDVELATSPQHWPPEPLAGSGSRREVDRRGASIVAAIAGLASGGGTLLVVCADTLRRRELVERAARPARFGGGALALVSARLPDGAAAAAAVVRDSGTGAVLADWNGLARAPWLVDGFDHVLVVDPAPFGALQLLATRGGGYLHRLDGDPEREFALRCHLDEWPSRSSLAELYRDLRDAGGASTTTVRERLCGAGRAHPRSPESAARGARVLAELGLVELSGSGASRSLGVVSSEGTDLERSVAFTAYRARREQGRACLTRPNQTPS